MTIKLKDLAKELGLSITQVSRALDGYDDVSEKTRERVLKAAQEHQYQPSAAAQHLRKARTNTIGYILPASEPRFSESFNADIIAGISDELSSQRIDLLLSSAGANTEEEKDIYRRWVQSERVDGLILNRVRVDDWRMQMLETNNFHYVSLECDKEVATAPCIRTNDCQGMESLTRHLIEQGHTRVALLGCNMQLVLHQNRQTGYLKVINQAGIEPLIPPIKLEDSSFESGYELAKKCLELYPEVTAMIGINDQVALGALSAVKTLGKRVGIDFAIAGYSGIDETEYSEPPLTTVVQPTYQIGRFLADAIFNLVYKKGSEFCPPAIEPQLHVRQSTNFKIP